MSESDEVYWSYGWIYGMLKLYPRNLSFLCKLKSQPKLHVNFIAYSENHIGSDNVIAAQNSGLGCNEQNQFAFS